MAHTKNISVYCIAATALKPAFYEWLKDVGRVDCDDDNVERLVEMAGRRCYMSFKPGLNANVTKIREDLGEYIDNILASKHGSVLEHVSFTFAIEGVTRVFTGEMNRHRAGVAISEGSMRYIRYDDIPYWLPQSIKNDKCLREIFEDVFNYIEGKIRYLNNVYLGDGVSFEEKKKYTSIIRRLLPMGTCTGGIWTFNLRALRHVITMRCSKAAEEEIAYVTKLILGCMKFACPNIFADMRIENEFATVKYEKV